VRETAPNSLIAAALTAAFNAGAGIFGFTVGGWLAVWAIRTGRARKPLALVCAAVYSVLVIIFGISISVEALAVLVGCSASGFLAGVHS
jgi:hypothetical protein